MEDTPKPTSMATVNSLVFRYSTLLVFYLFTENVLISKVVLLLTLLINNGLINIIFIEFKNL